MTPSPTLQDELDLLCQTMERIRHHHEWSNDEDSAMKLLDVVGEDIQCVLHNYKWRELNVVQAANKYLSYSKGNHGSDGKVVPEIESKTSKLSKLTLDNNVVVGMYDKIGSRVDYDVEIDVEALLEYISNSPVPVGRANLIGIVRNSTYRGKQNNIVFNSNRRAERLIDQLIKHKVLVERKGVIGITDHMYRAVPWPATLQVIGVARHEHTVFGLFGSKTGKNLLSLLCNSTDIEQHLGHVFEEKFERYSQQMNEKRENAMHGKATSANDATCLTLGHVLSLPSSKVIHVDTGAMAKERVSIDADVLQQLIKHCPHAGTKERLVKYDEHCKHVQKSKPNKPKKI